MLNITKNATLFALLAIANTAMAGPSIGTGGGAAFAIMREWFQNFVDFLAGPFGTAAVIASIIIGFCTWIMLPKEGIVGTIMRTVIGSIVILNVATWVTTFK